MAPTTCLVIYNLTSGQCRALRSKSHQEHWSLRRPSCSSYRAEKLSNGRVLDCTADWDNDGSGRECGRGDLLDELSLVHIDGSLYCRRVDAPSKCFLYSFVLRPAPLPTPSGSHDSSSHDHRCKGIGHALLDAVHNHASFLPSRPGQSSNRCLATNWGWQPIDGEGKGPVYDELKPPHLLWT